MRRVLLLPLLLAASCRGGADIELPDRSDPAVQRQEAALGRVLAADRSGEVLDQPGGSCRVLLLRAEGDTNYVWAHCSVPGGMAISAPFRVRGSVVDGTEDGNRHEPSLRQIFPADLADAVLKDSQRYRP